MRVFRPALILLFLVAPTLAQLAPSSMEVILLGTGYPVPDPERAGPSTAVVVNGKYFLVDAGRAVTMRLAALQPRMPHVTAVLLTHLHSDHTEGLPDFFATSWMMERRALPIELYGPTGTRELADGMLKFFAADIHIRRDLTEHQSANGARVIAHIVHEGVIYKDPDVTITAFAVDHRPVEPAFGYKFESGGKTVVISGDTAPSPNLVKYAKGADVLVHEVYAPGAFGSTDRPDVANTLARYHTDAEQVGRVAAEAGVKKLVLTHIIPPRSAETIRDLASHSYHGPIVMGTDLARIKVE